MVPNVENFGISYMSIIILSIIYIYIYIIIYRCQIKIKKEKNCGKHLHPEVFRRFQQVAMD